MRKACVFFMLLNTAFAGRGKTLSDKNVEEFFHSLSEFPSQNKSTEQKFMETGHVLEGFNFAPGMVSAQCLLCICKMESGCRPIGCRMDVGSLSCGYFQIKNAYWIDCGKPGRDLKSCGNDIYCSSKCVQNYMKRYAVRNHCPLNCEGFAREHNGGPTGCRNKNTIGYWHRLQKITGCRNPRFP